LGAILLSVYVAVQTFAAPSEQYVGDSILMEDDEEKSFRVVHKGIKALM